jgi:hypothetical protein
MQQLQLAGLLACSLLLNLPIDKAFRQHQQWYGVSNSRESVPAKPGAIGSWQWGNCLLI